ncbi:RagB/SusD family nutrient uptake outer membrane protein [Pyxidicoccus xibeiensis]|uniref:RagB/SusD family nutrient uptake outer membrane protein n=1 Tax=Pyxidicoccus xibeiensis TaxID=2906759 RepID=UPI0020A73EEB|nr:RagB/SusD family nutrient uptake outer membrane protein [Pyxidicoccus xibeiensis]MCP3144782.1 RagB/SusD family nutrient uptake outer membrane protein [Pyxidicoccus xibeiensis]
MTIHQTKKAFLALGAALTLGGCGSLDIPDLDNPSLDDFRDNPSPSAVYSAATGLLMGQRVGLAAQNGYIAELGVIGREAFIFDGAEPRLVEELLGPTLDPGGPAFGGNFWAAPYANIRNANTLLEALEKVPGVSDERKEGIRGFTKTMQALDFLVVINTRDTNGAPIDVGRPLGSALPPIEDKQRVLAHIATLLDEAAGHLAAAGGQFPFALSSGFRGDDPNSTTDDFNEPATFLTFNRAVRARVAVYQKDYGTALTALSQSFLNPSRPLSRGVYHVFSTDSGDLDNNLNSRNIFAHPSIVTDADKKADGSVDARVARKTRVLPPANSGTAADGRLASNLRVTLYPDGNANVPIIRNEELILLRAEANIGLGNFGPAADDINFIRTTSGELPARTDLAEANILDELLKQKRYSLFMEGGHRWIDLRRYDKLDTLPRELDPSFAPHARFPIPAQEMDARQ